MKMTNAETILINALRKIMKIGYGSKDSTAFYTILASLRIAESAIAEAEIASRQPPFASIPCYPTARSVNATLRCPSKTVYGIGSDGKKHRITAYKGVSKRRPQPEARLLSTGMWIRVTNVEYE